MSTARTPNPLIKSMRTFYVVPIQELVKKFLQGDKAAETDLLTRFYFKSAGDTCTLKWEKTSLETLTNPREITLLGLMYDFGVGIAVDTKKARLCYERADEDRIAQFRLGLMYYYDDKNTEKAKKYLEAARSKGVPGATNTLGCILEDEGDLNEGIKRFIEAEKNGCPWGTTSLAGSFKSGTGGLPENDDEAMKLYDKAVSRGNLSAFALLAKMVYSRPSFSFLNSLQKAVFYARYAAEEGRDYSMLLYLLREESSHIKSSGIYHAAIGLRNGKDKPELHELYDHYRSEFNSLRRTEPAEFEGFYREADDKPENIESLLEYNDEEKNQILRKLQKEPLTIDQIKISLGPLCPTDFSSEIKSIVNENAEAKSKIDKYKEVLPDMLSIFSGPKVKAKLDMIAKAELAEESYLKAWKNVFGI